MWVIKPDGLHYDTVSINKQTISLFHILGKEKKKKNITNSSSREREKRKIRELILLMQE